MPPTSRKRNKGKDRKAKQLIKKEENDKADANRFWLRFCGRRNQCNHGCDLLSVSGDHPVISFIDQFIINIHKNMVVSANLRNLFETHRRIWNNESYRKLLIDILIRIGTNMLLLGSSDVTWPICLGQSILVLGQYKGIDDLESAMHSRVIRSKWLDLNTYTSSCGGRRECLKFYRKRTTCKCLKKMHLEARKTIPKMGICYGCLKDYERVDLSVCSRCMVMPYCSRECQVADWPKHVSDCDIRRGEL